MANLTADALRRWQRDPIAFSQEALILRKPDGTLGPPVWTERQRSWLQALAATSASGAPKWRTVEIIAPKRSGKTLLSAVGMLWKTALGEDRRSICLANSRESAESLGFNQAKELVERSPLASSAEIQRGRIAFPALNSEILAVPCSAKTVAGLTVRSGLLVCDELWAADDEEPFDLLSSQTEGTLSQTLIVTQASGTDSAVYRLYQAAQTNAPGLFVDYVTPDELRAGLQLNPFVTDEFLASRRAALVGAVYDHYFLNEWGSTENAFLPAEIVDACREEYTLPKSPEEWAVLRDLWASGGPLIVAGGLDRAQPFSGRDASVFVVIARCPGDVYRVVWLEVMRTGAEAEILASYEKARKVFGTFSSIAETYQSADIAPKINAELRAATGPAQVGMFTHLHRCCTEGRFRFPASEEGDILHKQLKKFTVDTTKAQPRFTGGSGAAVDDAVFAACWAVQCGQERVLRKPSVIYGSEHNPDPDDDQGEDALTGGGWNHASAWSVTYAEERH